MKKLLLGILAVMLVFALVACGAQKEEEKPVEVVPVNEDVTPVVEPVEEPAAEEPSEEVGVGNTDASMVALVLEQHFKNEYPGVVEEVVPTNIKVYTADEIAADELLSSYELNEGDIMFDAEYELKIVDGYEDMMMFTAGTGEVDGSWIRNKANVGIARSGAEGYTLDAFGTAF